MYLEIEKQIMEYRKSLESNETILNKSLAAKILEFYTL